MQRSEQQSKMINEKKSNGILLEFFFGTVESEVSKQPYPSKYYCYFLNATPMTVVVYSIAMSHTSFIFVLLFGSLFSCLFVFIRFVPSYKCSLGTRNTLARRYV